MEESDLSRPWSELPIPALMLAFEKLRLKDRAGTVDCVARVCSSWADAAAAATTSIKLQRCSDTDSLHQWLCSRGAHVGVFRLEGTSPGGVITTQPCPRLECLELVGCSVDLSTGSQLLQDLFAATALKNLQFCEVKFQGEPDLAALLLALPGLKVLQLKYNTLLDTTQQPSSSTASALASEVQDSLWSAQHTTDKGHQCFTDTGMQIICKLTKLQGLMLHSMKAVTSVGLSGFSKLQCLDCLVLRGLTCDISLSAVPAFSQLTALTVLALVWNGNQPLARFDPAVLGCMAQLQGLCLWNCNPDRGTTGAAELLSRLGQLPKLHVLNLWNVQGVEECPPAAFSALTSSSVLTCLLLATVVTSR